MLAKKSKPNKDNENSIAVQNRMKKVFNILWRAVASVWMPPVALVGIVLAIFVEDVLWSKYPALLVRYIFDFEWFPSYTLVLLVLISAISAVLFFCDLARKKWRRALARVGLFAVGFATMWWIGDCYIHNFRGHQVSAIEICVAGKDTATIGEKDFSSDELFKILLLIHLKTRADSVAFVIGEDIGVQDFWINFLKRCSAVGIWHLAFRTADGEWPFFYMDTSSCVCSRRYLKIAAVRIGEGGVLSFEDNYRDDCGLDDVDENGVACNLFDDSESSVFGDGVSARYDAAAVVVNSNCRISLVAACVRRLNEAGFSTVYLFTYE